MGRRPAPHEVTKAEWVGLVWLRQGGACCAAVPGAVHWRAMGQPILYNEAGWKKRTKNVCVAVLSAFPKKGACVHRQPLGAKSPGLSTLCVLPHKAILTLPKPQPTSPSFRHSKLKNALAIAHWFLVPQGEQQSRAEKTGKSGGRLMEWTTCLVTLSLIPYPAHGFLLRLERRQRLCTLFFKVRF